MGRVYVQVKIRNLFDDSRVVDCNPLVDTGAAHLTLPTAWKERFGDIKTIREVECETATQEVVSAEICGPVEILLEGFDPVYGEVMFLNMKPDHGLYEPLLGYIVLEQAQAAVDMIGHKLIHGRRVDLK